MCLVDEADLMMGNMETVRKSSTWYKKLLFHAMDTAILNRYNYYLVKNFAHPTMKDFTHDLVYQLLEKCAAVPPEKGKYATLVNTPERLLHTEVLSEHYSEQMEQ